MQGKRCAATLEAVRIEEDRESAVFELPAKGGRARRPRSAKSGTCPAAQRASWTRGAGGASASGGSPGG
jgi:hypothetical protein